MGQRILLLEAGTFFAGVGGGSAGGGVRSRGVLGVKRLNVRAVANSTNSVPLPA